MQNTEILFLLFFLFLLKIGFFFCRYMLEPPCRGGSSEYPQSMLWNKKIGIYPCIPQFCYIKVGFEGVHISRTCFPDVSVRCQVQEVIDIIFQQRKKHSRRENNGACVLTQGQIYRICTLIVQFPSMSVQLMQPVSMI